MQSPRGPETIDIILGSQIILCTIYIYKGKQYNNRSISLVLRYHCKILLTKDQSQYPQFYYFSYNSLEKK